MVYRGKLSKGCAECRAKKTRCDTAKPSCGQCKRAGRICSGYRNIQGIRLVDQSFEVTSKLSKNLAATQRASAVFPSCQPTSSPSSDDTSSPRDVFEVSTVHAFPEPTFWLEGNARSTFFDQYINIPYDDHLKTELGFVAPVYGNSNSQSGMLENIISALGLAVMLKDHRDTSMSFLASQKYASALRQTQRALQNPKLAKSDETLATVLLLGLHELVTVDSLSNDIDKLSVHLQGSIRLLQLRGTSQMDKNQGNRMYHRIYSQVLLNSLHTSTPIPPALLRFGRSVAHKMHREELAGLKLLEVASRLCNILSTTKSAVPGSPLAVTSTQALQSLDDELTAWTASLSWRYRVRKVPVKNPDKSFLTHHEVYTSHIVASSWNTYRCVRIKLNSEILRLCPTSTNIAITNPPEDALKPQSVISDLSKDICQSVPFFLGEEVCWAWRDKLASPPTMFGAVSMVMPLCFAAGGNSESPAMGEWAVGQIERIAEGTGIAQARRILDEKRRERVEM